MESAILTYHDVKPGLITQAVVTQVRQNFVRVTLGVQVEANVVMHCYSCTVLSIKTT